MTLAAKEVPRLIPKNKFKLEECKKRDVFCPVREKYCAEYAIPIEKILQDEKSQNRMADSKPKNVSIIAEQMATEGQKLGICVEQKADGELYRRWGNTRFRGAKKVYDDFQGIIPGLPKGHVWASLYEEKPSELRRLQAKENNIHSHSTPANIYDNLRSMKDIIDDGHLDDPVKKYNDCDDFEKKERVKKEVERTMPHWKGRKFKSFWNRFKKSTASTFRTKTYDLKEMQDYFIRNNDYGILDLKDKIDKVGSGKGYNFKVITEDEYGKTVTKKVRFHFVFGSIREGAYLQSSYGARNVLDQVEEVVWIFGVSVANSSDLDKRRQEFIDDLEKWNAAQPEKFVDRALCLPQTTPEQKGPEAWIRDVKF